MANSDKNIRITANRDTTALPKIIFTGQSNNPIALNVLDDNTLSFEGSAGQLFSINNNLSSGYIFSINDISGIPSFRVNADGTVGIAEFLGNVGIGLTNPAYKLQISGSAGISGTANISGVLTLSSTTGSGSTSTGALVVSGGVGIGGSIFSSSAYASNISGVVFNNGAITNTGTITSTGVMTISNSSTTAFQVRDGSNSSKFNVDTVGGIVSVLSSTASTNSSTGALVVSGGVGIGGSAYIASVLTVGSGSSGLSFRTQVGSTTGAIYSTAITPSSNNFTLITDGSSVILNGTYGVYLSISNLNKIAITSNNVNIGIAADSTSTSTGALTVNGGVGIGGSVNIGRQLTVSGTARINSSVFNNPSTSSIGASLLQSGYIFGSFWTGLQLENGYLIYGRQVPGGSIIIEEPLTGAQVGGTGNVFAEALQHFKWGNDKYVVLASTGNSVLYSTSSVGAGNSWYYATLPTTASWQKLEYGNNRFIAIATGSTSAYSLDGVSWTLSTLPGNYTWSDIKYGNGVFVAGAGSTVAYTYDGIEWTIASNSVSSTHITFGNGLFFANSTSNTASYSRDGINWTNTTLPSDTHRASAYGNGVFVNVGNSTTSYYSTDLINWISGPGGSDGTTPKLLYFNNKFYFKENGSGYGKVVTGPSGTLDFSPRFTGDINNVEIGGIKPAAAEFTTLAASGPVRFVSGLASTNFKNGSVVITGGVGIGGSLYVASATAISGVTINAGVITGNLTGTATTSGFATTSNYSHQSGYGITAGLATTATYSHQSGYATTSGLATTATYSHQSGYAITSGSSATATTATYSHQSGYAITSGSSGSATTANNINVVNALSNSAHTLLFSPTATGSGVAVSSNTTLSYNPSTNILSTSGLAITATTASSSTSNGALQVAGGVGISGRLSFNQAAFGTTGIASIPSMAMIGNTGDPIFLSILEDNTISFEGSQGQLFSITPNLSTGYIYSVNDITGIPLLRANANANVTANEYAGNFGIGLSNPGYKFHVVGSVGFTSTTASTSTSTGTLVVSGGVGIGGSLNVNSASNISNVIINNGVVTGNLTGTATTSGFATTASYSNQAGYAITAGSSNTSGYATTSGLATTATYSYQSGYGLTSGFATTASYAYQSGYGLTSGFATTASYSHQAGYAITAGSATTAVTAVSTTTVNVASAGSSNLAHQILITNNPSSGSAVSSDSTFTFNPSTEILSVSGISVTSTTASTSFDSGALVVSGGVGIGGSLFVNGDLTINGTTTTINSVTLSVDDKNIELGSVSSPSDVTAEGGGITLKGATDKNINWYSGVGWSSSESWNLVSGNSYKINNVSVLNATTLGTGVTNSSLTSLGTITTGVWAGTLITALYGGVGLTTPFTVGDLLYANTSTTWDRLAAGTSGHLLSSTGTGSTPSYVNPNTLTVGSATTASNLRIAVAGSNLSHPVLFTPGSSTSGSAVSSDSTFSFNSSTEILSVSGLAVTSTTASSGSTTGALTVAGGVGIGGTVNIAGDETVLGRLYYSQSTVGVAGTSTIPSISFIGQDNNPITLSVLTDNTLSFEGSSGQLFSINNNLSSGTIFSVNDISGIPIIRANANGTLSMGEFTGTVGVGLTNPSFKFHVSGSAGFSGTIYATGNVSLASNTASTSTTNGALTISGGVGIGGSLYVASATAISGVTINAGVITGSLTGLATTATYSHQSGYAITSGIATTAGYASIANTSYSVNVNSASANSSHYLIFSPNASGSGIALSTESALVYNPSTDILSASGISITSSTASTSTSTGALIVEGGVGIGQSLFTSSSYPSSISGVVFNNGAITNTGTITSTGVMSISNSSTTAFSVKDGSNDTKFNVNTIGGIVSVSSSTASTNTSTGAFTVSGGVGIGGTLNANTVNVVRDFNHTPNITTIGGASGWVASTASTFITPNTFKYLNNKYIGIGGTYIYYSDDMINWSSVMVPNLDPARNISDITYGEGKYVFVQYYTSNAGYSTNLTNWTTNVALTYNTWFRVVYGNGRFVADSGNSPYAYSLDGISWTSVFDSRFGYGTSLQFLNGYFYSCNGNSLIRSTDGINWQSCNTTSIPIGLAYGNGLYVGGVYNSGTIVYSYDGLNFSSYSGTSYVHNNSWFYNGVYYLTTNNNLAIRYSTDGFNWSIVGGFPSSVNNLQYIKGKLYAGSGNTVWVTDATPGRFEVNPLRTGTLDDVEIGRLSPNNANFIDVSVNNNLNVSSQYDSASYLDGALTVAGGVGIGKTVNVQGSVNISNSLNLVNRTTGIATTWTRTVVGTAATISYLAYANNLYVGVGYSSLTSTDGVNWTTRTLPNNLSFVSYGNGIWSGLLFNSALGATSTNGTTWTSYAMTNSRQWTMMAFGNGKFVTLARNTNIAAYSTNGYNWTEVSLPTTGSPVWVWLTFGGGYFVGVANGSATAVYSTDGINWNTTTLPSAGGWNCVTYGNGYYYVTGSGAASAYSRDLINWTTYNHSISGTAFAAYNNGAFVVVDVSGATSTNIITGDFSPRTQINLPGPQIPTTVVAGDRNFIAGFGQTFYTFPIPNNSITLNPNTTGEINNVEIGSVKPAAGNFSNLYSQNIAAIGSTIRSTSPYNGALTVLGGAGIAGTLNANSVVTYNRLQNQSFSGSSVGSTDGLMGNFSTNYQYQSYGNGIYVVSSPGANNARYSTDGVTWQNTTLPVNQAYPINFYGNGYFVLSASGSTTVLYSTNGSSWSQVSIGNTFARTSGVYGNGKYIIVGSGSTYNYSNNLTTWSSATLPFDSTWYITYGNGMFVALGNGTRNLLYSYDGLNWNLGNINTTAGPWSGIKYGNGVFVASSYANPSNNTSGTIYSYDGINWSQGSISNQDFFNVSYGNGVYFGNNQNAYWTSTDGANWSSGLSFSGGFQSYQSAYAYNKFNTIGRFIDGPTNTVTIEPKFTGEINNVRIGAITPASGDFTNLSSTGSANLVGTVNANNLNILSKVNQTPVLGSFAGTTGWTSPILIASDNNYALAFGNGLFVQIRRNTNSTNFSSDARRWTGSTMPFTGDWNGVVWGLDKFVAVAGTGTTGAFSRNGIAWTSMNMPSTAQGWIAVTYGDDKFVAVGNTSTAAYSSDGITWSGSSIASTTWAAITYGNGTFVAVASIGRSAAYSHDGIVWNLVNLPTTTTNWQDKKITYGNGYFVVTTYNTAGYDYSRDGVNWSTVGVSGLNRPITYGNGIYSVLNYSNAYYAQDITSTTNWLTSNTINSTDWIAFTYGNNRFVATSYNTGAVAQIDGPSNTLNLHPKFTGDIDNVRIGAKQPGAAEFTNLAAQQPVRFTANTASINTNTGALVVVGGVGIGGSLYVSSATAISGVIINAGVITGSLTGTASTATYSHQSGYAITSGSSGAATTATYAHQSGYGITAGFATSSTSASIANTSYSVNVNAASANSSHFLIFSPTATGSGVALSTESALVYNPSTDILSVSGLAVTSGTASTSATTGALVVTGGVGIGQTLTVGLGISTPSVTAPANLILKPGADSTTGIQLTRSSSAIPVISIDTLNSRVGIGLTNPEFDLEVNGSISATTKSFVIEHPTKEGMKLRYGSLEGPENGVYVRGELKDNNTIILPDYWSELIDESSITVHLTPIGNKFVYVKEIKKDSVIVGSMFFQKIHCYYSVWAERKDVPKLKVEF